MISKPPSAVPGHVALSGAIGAVVASFIIWHTRPNDLVAIVLFMLASAAPMWALELRRFPQLRPEQRPRIQNWRRRVRVYGVALVYVLFYSTYTIFIYACPAYMIGLREELILVLPVIALWTAWIIFRRPTGYRLDSVESLGKIVARGWRHALLRHEIQVILGWLVKAFFLPLMISSAYVFLSTTIMKIDSTAGWFRAFTVLYGLLFAVDTAFATIGYCSTSRRIDAHIRSTEPTVFGWLVALICYPPLSLIVFQQWLSYADGLAWDEWLRNWPVLSFVWGSSILLMVGLYVSATVAFGPRFSNLTNRGIITSGPYRYFKHPSYIGKNAAWWLISVPFVSNLGAAAAITNCLALIVVGGIYFARAKTEEKHLMRDPTYRAYAKWISEHGLVAKALRTSQRANTMLLRN